MNLATTKLQPVRDALATHAFGLCTLMAFPLTGLGNEALIEKGRVLATAADCTSCHTSKEGKPYAGGHVIESPFGDLVTPNITPDIDTGIGEWTLDDFRSIA